MEYVLDPHHKVHALHAHVSQKGKDRFLDRERKHITLQSKPNQKKKKNRKKENVKIIENSEEIFLSFLSNFPGIFNYVFIFSGNKLKVRTCLVIFDLSYLDLFVKLISSAV